ncbi:hypothetical protein [Ensifer sp. 4252]|uniref:hypothetical protein n=1 Tax=Ensifer sp. 4252 TaxID=3373915 RepID=UPI003D1A63BC
MFQAGAFFFWRSLTAPARVYAFDLVGAAIGALGTVGLLFLVFPSAAPRFVAALGFAAAALAATGMARHRWLAAGSLGIAAAVIAVWLPPSLDIAALPDKP